MSGGATLTAQVSQQPFTLTSQVSDVGQSTFGSAPIHALRELSRRLITAQEDERSRIARELHDDVNQRLSLLAVELELVALHECGDNPAAREQLATMTEQVKDLVSDVQTMSHALHPSKLRLLGLVRALQSLCTDESKLHGIDVRFKAVAVPDSIPPNISLCLYRVTQEALRNVVKHSRTSDAAVSLVSRRDQITLSVSDSGCGIDRANAHVGLGLTSMRERVSHVAGQLGVASARGRGTRITATIPLPRGQND